MLKITLTSLRHRQKKKKTKPQDNEMAKNLKREKTKKGKCTETQLQYRNGNWNCYDMDEWILKQINLKVHNNKNHLLVTYLCLLLLLVLVTYQTNMFDRH